MKTRVALCLLLIWLAGCGKSTERPDTAALSALPARIGAFRGERPRVYEDERLGTSRAYNSDDIVVTVYVYPAGNGRTRDDLLTTELRNAQEELMRAKEQGLYQMVDTLTIPDALSAGLAPLGSLSYHAVQYAEDVIPDSEERRSIIWITVKEGFFLKTRTSYERPVELDYTAIVEFHRDLVERLHIPDQQVGQSRASGIQPCQPGVLVDGTAWWSARLSEAQRLNPRMVCT